MRKTHVVLLFTFLLQACASIPFGESLFPATNTAEPSPTPSITPTLTRTPAPTNTPRPSATATIVRFPTQDPDLPTATFPTVPIYIGNATATGFTILVSTPLILSSPSPGVGFDSVTVSPNKVYWGICKHNKVTIVAEVEDEDEVWSVVIFVRVKSAKEEDYTPWTTGDAMHNHRDGTFSYVMEAIEINGHNHYKDSWVQFQLVAVDVDGVEVGRTQIFIESIHMSPCMELGD